MRSKRVVIERGWLFKAYGEIRGTEHSWRGSPQMFRTEVAARKYGKPVRAELVVVSEDR